MRILRELRVRRPAQPLDCFEAIPVSMPPDISLCDPISDQIAFGVGDSHFPIGSVPGEDVVRVVDGTTCQTQGQQERKEPVKTHAGTMAGGKMAGKVNATKEANSERAKEPVFGNENASPARAGEALSVRSQEGEKTK